MRKLRSWYCLIFDKWDILQAYIKERILCTRYDKRYRKCDMQREKQKTISKRDWKQILNKIVQHTPLPPTTLYFFFSFFFMVKSSKNGVVAENAEVEVPKNASPVFDVDSRDEWDLPSSMVKSITPHTPYDGVVMKSNYDLDASFDTDDMDDLERTLLAMQGWPNASVPTLRCVREKNDKDEVIFSGIVVSRQGDKSKLCGIEKVQSGANPLPESTDVILLFRTEKYDLGESIQNRTEPRGGSTEYFSSMSKVVLTHYPMWPNPKLSNGNYMLREEVPSESTVFGSQKELKEYLKTMKLANDKFRSPRLIVLYMLFKNEIWQREPAKMYLKYTQSAGAKNIGWEFKPLLMDPLPGTLKKIDRMYRSPVHFQRTFNMRREGYSLGATFVSHPFFEIIKEPVDRPSNDEIKCHIKDIMMDVSSKLKSRLSNPELHIA